MAISYPGAGGEMQILTDEELLRDGRNGDRCAVEALLRRYTAATRASLHLNPKWASVIDLDDIMQTTLLEAYLDFGHFRGSAAGLPAWLRTIAQHNLQDAVSFLHAEKRPPPERRYGNDETLETLGTNGEAEAAVGPAQRAEMRRMLEAEVAELPPDCAEIIRLVYFHDLSIRHAAERLGRSPDSAYVLWRRALAKLAKHMRPALPTETPAP